MREYQWWKAGDSAPWHLFKTGRTACGLSDDDFPHPDDPTVDWQVATATRDRELPGEVCETCEVAARLLVDRRSAIHAPLGEVDVTSFDSGGVREFLTTRLEER